MSRVKLRGNRVLVAPDNRGVVGDCECNPCQVPIGILLNVNQNLAETYYLRPGEERGAAMPGYWPGPINMRYNTDETLTIQLRDLFDAVVAEKTVAVVQDSIPRFDSVIYVDGAITPNVWNIIPFAWRGPHESSLDRFDTEFNRSIACCDPLVTGQPGVSPVSHIAGHVSDSENFNGGVTFGIAGHLAQTFRNSTTSKHSLI